MELSRGKSRNVEETKNVMLISEKESVILRSIEKKLDEMKINSLIVRAKIDKIEDRRNDAELFIMYLPDQISEDLMKALVYLADYVEESNKPLILIGEVEMKGILLTRFKRLGSFLMWLDRPLDIDELGLQVKRVFNSQAKQTLMRRILIVDDDPNYAKMVRDWLKDVYKVDMVSSGAQTISFLSKNRVDLILLDYEMPVVDGPQVLQMLREDGATANIPVIFLTGIGDKESVARVLSLKPQGYILKSTTRGNLIATLRDFFSK
ncbi:response regulator [Butyrivibrio sp. VCD2006]|uniref:response regulator n=1 Tax=Butyrivibrio sp. VCD2006 TaxID=1280664 RepID=UPI0004258763|nr:response regulator [Butyrivibrio sp. VCD2006]